MEMIRQAPPFQTGGEILRPHFHNAFMQVTLLTTIVPRALNLWTVHDQSFF